MKPPLPGSKVVREGSESAGGPAPAEPMTHAGQPLIPPLAEMMVVGENGGSMTGRIPGEHKMAAKAARSVMDGDKNEGTTATAGADR